MGKDFLFTKSDLAEGAGGGSIFLEQNGGKTSFAPDAVLVTVGHSINPPVSFIPVPLWRVQREGLSFRFGIGIAYKR